MTPSETAIAAIQKMQADLNTLTAFTERLQAQLNLSQAREIDAQKNCDHARKERDHWMGIARGQKAKEGTEK